MFTILIITLLVLTLTGGGYGGLRAHIVHMPRLWGLAG